MNKNSFRMAVGFAGLIAPAVCSAHHSFALFDFAHPAMLTGTVKSFDWANPHTHVELLVPNGAGGADVWELTGGSVNSLIRQGYTKSTLQPGMTVRLKIAPRHDGKPGGEFMNVLGVETGGKFVSPPAAN